MPKGKNLENNNLNKPEKNPDNIIEANSNIEKIFDYNKLNSSITTLAEKLSQINYSALNKASVSAIQSLSNNYDTINSSVTTLAQKVAQFDYAAINKATISAVENLSLNYSTISNSATTLAQKISQFDYSAMNNATISAVEKLSLNYSLINNSMASLAEKLSKIDYHSLNNSMLSFTERLSKCSNPLLNNSVASLHQKLSKLAITEDQFRSFMNNFKSFSDVVSLDELDFDSISNEDSMEIESSSKQIVEKVLTGTLECSDVQNNKPRIYCIIIINFLLTFILNYMLTLGLDSIRENFKTSNSSENTSLSSEESINLKIITTDNLNVRQTPTTKSEIIYQLETFDIVYVINEQPYWYEIKYIDLSENQSKTGWIAKKYTKDYFSTLDYYSEYFSE